jgi:hypothetical protein
VSELLVQEGDIRLFSDHWAVYKMTAFSGVMVARPWEFDDYQAYSKSLHRVLRLM